MVTISFSTSGGAATNRERRLIERIRYVKKYVYMHALSLYKLKVSIIPRVYKREEKSIKLLKSCFKHIMQVYFVLQKDLLQAGILGLDTLFSLLSALGYNM